MPACFLVPSVIMLIQLIYASAASRPISQLELELLLTKSRQKNFRGVKGDFTPAVTFRTPTELPQWIRAFALRRMATRAA